MNWPTNWIITDALAQNGGQAPQGGGISFLIMIAIFFAIMYFLIIRPQSKRAKEHKQLIESLSVGDEVVTTGGLVGRITAVEETFARIEFADNVQMKVQKTAVAGMMPKGTLKGD